MKNINLRILIICTVIMLLIVSAYFYFDQQKQFLAQGNATNGSDKIFTHPQSKDSPIAYVQSDSKYEANLLLENFQQWVMHRGGWRMVQDVLEHRKLNERRFLSLLDLAGIERRQHGRYTIVLEGGYDNKTDILLIKTPTDICVIECKRGYNISSSSFIQADKYGKTYDTDKILLGVIHLNDNDFKKGRAFIENNPGLAENIWAIDARKQRPASKMG